MKFLTNTNISPYVSIIVPVYNVENSLSRCIDSILGQTYPHFELILVNDGSKDGSGAICDEYAAKDDRIKVIHIPNGGVSNARNTGLDAATGEYVIFVDSDDWVLPEHIAQLMPCGDEDWVCCGIQFYKNGNSVRSQFCPANTIHRTQWVSDFAQFWSIYGVNSPCRCIYKTSIIREHHLHFDKALSIAEDELFNLNYILHCNILRYVESCTYCYETGFGGTLMGKHHPDRNDSSTKVVQAMEFISQKTEFLMRWREWRTAIAHHRFHLRRNKGSAKKAIRQHLKNCYRESFFRECIPFIRQNGSFDEKIETYFMTPFLHPMYPIFYKIITLPLRMKRK